jgi:signal transduction histidine kinase
VQAPWSAAGGEVAYAGRRFAPTLLLGIAAAALVWAWWLERGNVPSTEEFGTSTDYAVVAAMFTVPVIGSVLLALRPHHRTGWLMLWSGLALAAAMLCHAAAVRLLLVAPAYHLLGEASAWVARWSVPLAFGLLPFVVATWPDGRIESSWLRRLAALATAGLGIAVAAEAVLPRPLDGVAPANPIDNPFGVHSLGRAGGVALAAGVVLLIVFAGATVIDVLVRTGRAAGERRARLLPVALVVVAIPAALLVSLLVDSAGIPAVLVLAVGGLSGALALAARGIRRTQRAERARAMLVAEREDERRRVRRDLHDGVGPLLAALRLELDGARSDAAGGRAKLLLDQAIGEVRRISRDLRPIALDELGMLGALRQQAAILGAPAGPVITVEVPDRPPVLPAAVEVAVLRISGEALTNVVRHSRATTCGLQLWTDTALHLCVRDNGTGLGAGGDSGGLRSMRDRAEELGGRLDVRASEGGGTVVEAVLPLLIGAP